MVSVGARLLTYEDLVKLPDDGKRYEIIDGELYVAKAPGWNHQYTCDGIVMALRNWDRQTGVGVTVSGPGLIFPSDENVIPDVVWIRRERLAAALDEAGHLRQAPELVVEVLSPGRANEVRDLELKLELYSRQGVHEYWVVDGSGRTVRVYRREQATLQLVTTLGGDDALTTPLLLGFACPLGSLWESPV